MHTQESHHSCLDHGREERLARQVLLLAMSLMLAVNAHVCTPSVAAGDLEELWGNPDARFAPYGTDLIEAGGFETAGPWTLPRGLFERSDGAAASGDFSLHYSNDNPERYDFARQRLDLQPNVLYHFAADIRVDRLEGEGSGGATIAVQWFDGNGEYIKGAFATPEVTETNGKWRRVEFITDFIPPRAERIELICRVKKGMAGEAWFDNISLRRIHSPLLEQVHTDAFRNRTDGGPVKVGVGVNPEPYGLSPAELNPRLTVRDRADGRVAAIARPTTLDNQIVQFEIDAETLPVGEYELNVSLGLEDGPEVSRVGTLFRVDRLEQPVRHFDRHGRFVDHGRLTFPLGMYASKVNDRLLADFQSAGLNTVLPYVSWRMTPRRLDRLQEAGIRMIYAINGVYEGHSQYEDWFGAASPSPAAAAKSAVRRMGDHPSVLAWYNADELEPHYLPALRERYELLQRVDPRRISFGLYMHRQMPRLSEYAATADVLALDPYPIRRTNEQVDLALKYTLRLRQATGGVKPMWMVPQAFSWWGWRGNFKEGYRAPTYREMRNMTWQCLVGGAKGLIFYSWMDLRRASDQGAEPYAQRWDEVTRMIAEIKPLSDVLLAAEQTYAPSDVETTADIAVRSIIHDGRRFLIAVNPSPNKMGSLRVPRSAVANPLPLLGPSKRESSEDHTAFRLDPLDVLVVAGESKR